MERDNVIMLKGNHEHMMLPILEELCYADKAKRQEIINDSLAVNHIGQEKTLNDFCQLSKKEQLKIIDYLSNLDIYKEITVNSRNYLLVHAGLPDFEEKYDLEYYTEEELLFGEHDFDINHFEDRTVVVGHVPTRFLNGAEPDEIFRINDSICIDCGLGFGGKIGVLCLDTDEEFYF